MSQVKAKLYRQNIQKIEKGSVLDLGGGLTVAVDQILGEGNTTLVVAPQVSGVCAGKIALRIPKLNGVFKVDRNGYDHYYIDYIDYFKRGAIELGTTEIPVVKVLKASDCPDLPPKLFEHPGIAVVEKLEIQYTLKSVLEKWEGDPRFKKQAFRLFEALKEFAVKSYELQNISDFHADNIAYVCRKIAKGKRECQWTLMDFGSGSRRAFRIDDPTVFDDERYLTMPFFWREDLQELVIKTREANEGQLVAGCLIAFEGKHRPDDQLPTAKKDKKQSPTKKQNTATDQYE